MSARNDICPHGHPVILQQLPDGYVQAVGGHVADDHPILGGQDCPMCIERNWKGVPYKNGEKPGMPEQKS